MRSVTVNLVATYQVCCNDFGYSETHAPRRVLTKLSKGVYNSNYDNAEHDYICRVGDKIVNPDGHTYEILERLGHGTFGQVLKCHHSGSSSHVALKIIKNKPAYFHQALVEVRILQMLNQELDPDDDKRIVRMLDFFVYRKHLCIAFELLSVNLYEVLKQNSFRGVSMALIRVLTDQLLKAMRCLREASVIHCDLKPENVLLSNIHHTRIKLIDFGSACFESHTVYPYIQSRFYRSPEVLLGVPYTSAIDMWSLGCICAELFLGLPVFPGHSEYDQVRRMVEVLGMPPSTLLDAGRNTKRYFRKEELKPNEPGAEGPSTSSADGEQEPQEPQELDANAQEAPQEVHSASSSGPEDGRASAERERPVQAEVTGAEHVSEEEDPRVYVVTGAGGVGSSCNGEYRRVGEHNQKPLYKKTNGDAIIFFNLRWKMNSIHDTRGWYYMAPDVSSATPPEGPWTTEQYDQDDADPAPVVSTLKIEAKSSFLDLLKHRLGIHADDAEEKSFKVQDAKVEEHPLDASTSASTALDTDGTASGGGPRRDDSDATGSRTGRSSGPGRPPFARRKSKRRQMAWRLKTKEEYERDEHKKEPVPKKYFNFSSLEQMVTLAPYRSNLSRRQLKEEKERRLCFLQFLGGLLQLNPDLRWTPKQASAHPFIMGKAHDPDFRPPPPDHPVPNFQKANPPSRLPGRDVPPRPSVPMLPKGKLGPPSTEGASSARAWEEQNASGFESDQTRSAPATTREGPGEETGGMSHIKTDTAMPESALSGLWGQLCMGIPLPDDNPAESYRPPIDQMSERFFRSFMQVAGRRPSEVSTEGEPGTASPPKAAGTSFCSSASSAGSPTGRPAGPGPSPLLKPTDLRLMGLRSAGAGASSTPGGSSTTAPRPGSGPMTSSIDRQTPQRGGSATLGRASLSRGGSRGSSPWHLPSPMSELSFASERVNSSQPSGSDSCEEPRHLGSEMAFNFEDPSGISSDAHGPSDCGSPWIPESSASGAREQKDVQSAMWESLKYEMTRVELGRDRLPRRLEMQSPGSTGALGTFREAIGMNDNGPVIPISAARHQQTLGTGTAEETTSSTGLFSISRSVDGHMGFGFPGSSRRKSKRPQ